MGQGIRKVRKEGARPLLVSKLERKHRRESGDEKLARICVLYVRETVDELIYEKEDWDRLLGVERNIYFEWDLPEPPREAHGPPKSYLPDETEIDLESLQPGDVYPGRAEGQEYSCDTTVNVRDPEGRIALNPQDVPKIVARGKTEPTHIPKLLAGSVPVEARL